MLIKAFVGGMISWRSLSYEMKGSEDPDFG